MTDNTLDIEIQTLAHGEGLDPPAYGSAHAAGLDLMAALPQDRALTLGPGDRALVPTGFAVALPPGFEAQVRPRSGLALKSGLGILNSPGTIDADYRGEIGVILINQGTEDFTVNRGMRIAQLVVAPVARVAWRPVAALDETARGDGGFGSTGTDPKAVKSIGGAGSRS